MASIRYWLKGVQPKRIIMFVLALLIALLLLISTFPNNFMPQSASANPAVHNDATPDVRYWEWREWVGEVGDALIGVKYGPVEKEGNPKLKEEILTAKPTGKTAQREERGPKRGAEEMSVGLKKFDISIKLKLNECVVHTWDEREMLETKEIWMMQTYRQKRYGRIGGINWDYVMEDIVWQEEIPNTRSKITEPKWRKVDGTDEYKSDDPPGDEILPWSKEALPQTGKLTLDYIWIDNIAPAAPPGTITHKLFLDGDSIADGTKIDLMSLELGDHETLVELHTIDGQIIPIYRPFTLVPPIELLPHSGSEVFFDEMERIEFTVKNNLNTTTDVNLRIESVPPGWDVHLCATNVSVPASGESTFEVMVSPTIGAFPEYSMNAVVTASPFYSGYRASANLDVEAAFPDNAKIYRLEIDGKELLALSIPEDTSLSNFRFEDGEILFESEQADTGFALIIPNSLLAGPLQAVGPGGDVVPSIENIFLSDTHGLFFSAIHESGTVTISKKDLEILTEIGPTLPSEELPEEVKELSEEVAELSEKVEELFAEIAALTVENAELGGSAGRNLIIGLVAGLLVGGGVIFAVMRRRKKVKADLE